VERRRLERRGESPWTLRNDVLNAWAMSVVLWGGLMVAFGAGVLPYLLVQAVVGIWLLESVNYLEHYGMLRQRTESGRYERVNAGHSWNSNNIGTNVLLYHLQRHSDHHAHPTRRYQTLRDVPEAPVLPTGYAGMIVLTWVPALWRAVMDKRVVGHFGGDVSRANLQPSRREHYLRTYPPRRTADA
jgi:alkane 1-monooxygenase